VHVLERQRDEIPYHSSEPVTIAEQAARRISPNKKHIQRGIVAGWYRCDLVGFFFGRVRMNLFDIHCCLLQNVQFWTHPHCLRPQENRKDQKLQALDAAVRWLQYQSILCAPMEVVGEVLISDPWRVQSQRWFGREHLLFDIRCPI
jgi:hypothetical protein